MAEIEIEGSDLAAILADEIRDCQTFDQTKRTLAIEYMRGDMSDLPARTNGSSQTSRDVADTVSWMLPGIVRVFTGSDQMVEFEATQPGGEQGAEEASEYQNYGFFRENDGYRILRDVTYDSLLLGNGVPCSYWEPEKLTTKLFKDKTAEELALLLEEGWQGMGVAPKPGKMTTLETEMGPVEVPTFTVRLQQVTERGQIRDMVLKPENVEISGTATCFEEARYTGYVHDHLTRSDLIEMADEYGWDAELIAELPSYTKSTTDREEVSRAREPNRFIENSNSPLKSGDLLYPREAYLRADKDGDGIAELLRIWAVGSDSKLTILSEDEWDGDIPWTDIPCYPVAHSFQAEGVFDRVADIQRVKTTLLRQALDNTYSVNMPMREVEEGSVINPDILVNPRFNGLIWKKKASAPIVPHEIPYIAAKAFAAMEYMDTISAKRTGVSKQTMALDPEALQNQSATGTQLAHDAAYSQIELVARDMAEIGWVKFFSKRRNIAKKYVKGQVQIPSRNGDVAQGQQGQGTAKYRTIQPEAWGDDMAVSINTGLGTGSRDRDMAMLAGIKNGQMMMAQALQANGMSAKAIEFIPKIIKTAIQEAEASGLKNPASYYPEFSEEEVKAAIEAANQPKPDPAIMLEQAKGQVTLQVEAGKNELAMKQAEIDSAAQVRREQAQLEADLTTAEADRQAELAKQRGELQFKYTELSQERELELLKLGMQERASGELDAEGNPIKKPVDATAAMLMDGLGKLGEALDKMHQSSNAPVEVVRGPDGKMIGARKVAIN